MNHDQGFDNLPESRVPPSALNRSQSKPIQKASQKQAPGFSDRGASDPAIGIPVKGKPNQILAGIPVFRVKPTPQNPSAP